MSDEAPPSDHELLYRSLERSRAGRSIAPLPPEPPRDLIILDGGITAGEAHVPPPENRGGGTPGSSASVATPRPFQIIPLDSSTLRVVVGTLAGQIPDGFASSDSPIFTLSISGSGQVYGRVAYSRSGGVVTGGIDSREILFGSATPPDDHTNAIFYVPLGGAAAGIGSAKATATNYRYSPIDMNVYRDFFVIPPQYDVVISGP